MALGICLLVQPVSSLDRKSCTIAMASQANFVAMYFHFRRLWITCVSFGAVGVGAALAVTPVYADILGIGK